jgi:hypothetical protein
MIRTQISMAAADFSRIQIQCSQMQYQLLPIVLAQSRHSCEIQNIFQTTIAQIFEDFLENKKLDLLKILSL